MPDRAELAALIQHTARATESPDVLAKEMGLDPVDLAGACSGILLAKNSTEARRIMFALEVGFRLGERSGG